LTDAGVLNGLVLVEDVYLPQPFSAIHEMVLRDVERQSVNGGDIEYVGNRLVILVVVWRHFSDILVQERFVEIDTVSLSFYSVFVKRVTAVSLYLGDEERHVVGFELVGREYLGSCSIEVVFLRPR
jgi:hypothetical protein